jgi:uncharacterized membrane protein
MIKERFWEIDLLRGIAIVLMIIFNYSFALSYLNVYNFNGGWLYWDLFPRFIATLFISIAGLALTLNYNQTKDKKKVFLRGLKIFGAGLLITFVTFLTFPGAFIVFGILHLIGISIILGLFFLNFKRLNILLGLSLIALGIYLQNFIFDFKWLLWLGFTPENFYTFDYFPILPWFGVFLIGLYLGNVFYKNGKRIYKIKDFSNVSFVRFFSFLGRKSLIIYLLHQPFLIMILLISGFKIF